MIRQYRIVTKSVSDPEPKQLQPIVHASLYNFGELRSAVDYMRANPTVEMVAIRLNSRFYSVVAVHNDKLLPDHFEF